MESSVARDSLDLLIPVLSEKDKKDILAYFHVNEKYGDEMSNRFIEDLRDHPIFGALVRELPPEVNEARNKFTRALQKDAIVNGNWRPYIDYQIQQGIGYAKMGLDFRSWYEIVGLARVYLMPYLEREYERGPEFLAALNGLNVFMDIGMSILGEAYMQEKKELIKQANDHLVSIFETTADIIFVVEVEDNERYKFSSVNKSFTTTTGIPFDAVIGKYVDEVVPAASLPHILEKYREAACGKKIVRWDESMQYPNGLLIGEISISPLCDDNGKCIRLVGAIHDITDRKRAEEEVKQLNEVLETKVLERTAQLESVNKELEAFTYSVSHDLRAPLRAVNGYAEMLNEDYGNILDDEGKRIVATISESAAKMGTLIDELLAFSQLGRKEIKKARIDMNELVDGVLVDIAKCTPHTAKISVGHLHSVKGDYGLLHQVMFNLLSNAVKYSANVPQPMVEVKSVEENGEVIFSIQDNGAGFDMKYADKLFGVFQRLHSQDEFDGSGVGLAIVHRIIARHGGRVWAEGKVGEGATFYISLMQ